MDLIFGRRMLVHWLLDPQIVYLNHGTVGATPIPVIEHWRRIQDEIERQPAQYLLRELADHAAIGEPAAPRMRVAARSIARSVGCDADQFVFVDNATAGCNAVLRSFPLERGEDIAITSLGYGGVNHAADFIARERGATVRTIELPLPGAVPDEYVAAIEAGLSPRTRLLMVDHITSQTALVLPLAEIAAVCRRRGIAVLADGAHAPGAIELDIESLGVDFYVANLHKWWWAPRACGFVWVAKSRVTQLRPTVLSWGYRNGLAAEFDLPGTRDPSNCLAAPHAVDLWQRWGGKKILEYNHALVLRSAARLSEGWGTRFSTPAQMIGPMAWLRLPPPLGDTTAGAVALQRSLLAEDGIEVPIHAGPGGLSCRISAQIYNDDSDFDRLADAITRRVRRSQTLRGNA